MKRHTVITHAPTRADQGTPVSADQGTGPSMIALNLATLADTDRDLIIRFRDMINHGQGGASGLHAGTRLDALVGLAHLLRTNPQGAVKIAGAVSLGVRSQGAAITNLVGFVREAREARSA